MSRDQDEEEKLERVDESLGGGVPIKKPPTYKKGPENKEKGK